MVYVIGNHDDFLMNFVGEKLGDIKIVREYVYEDMLVIHGDQFDSIVKYHKWLAFLGAWGYKHVLWISRKQQKWFKTKKSLARWIKEKSKNVGGYIDAFKSSALKYAKDNGYDSVCTGHIHKPLLENQPNKMLYINCGDFIEHFNVVLKNNEGIFELKEFD